MSWFFANPGVGAPASGFGDRRVVVMRRSTAKMAAAAVAAMIAGTTTAEAELLSPSALPDALQLANTGLCNSSSGCPSYRNSPTSWTVYDVFTLAQSATITDFGFYSYLDGVSAADYLSTNWSIWEVSGSGTKPSTAVVGPTTSVGAISTGAKSDPVLITVDNLNVNLAAGAYWIGFQNNLSAGYSTYATTTDVDPSVYFGQDTPATTQAYYDQVAFYIDGAYNSGSGGVPPIGGGGGGPVPGVPEPSTWVMTLFGFAGLAWLARRRVARTRMARFEAA